MNHKSPVKLHERGSFTCELTGTKLLWGWFSSIKHQLWFVPSEPFLDFQNKNFVYVVSQ